MSTFRTRAGQCTPSRIVASAVLAVAALAPTSRVALADELLIAVSAGPAEDALRAWLRGLERQLGAVQGELTVLRHQEVARLIAPTALIVEPGHSFEPLNAMLADARNAYYAARFDQARETLLKMMERLGVSPDLPLRYHLLHEARLLLARLAIQQGKSEEAIAVYVDALRSNPTLTLDPLQFSPDELTLFKRARRQLDEGPSGTLVVDSSPAGAMVLIDGQIRGRTPARLSLPHGSYLLKLEGDDLQTLSRFVKIGEATTQLTIDLELEASFSPSGEVLVVSPDGVPDVSQLRRTAKAAGATIIALLAAGGEDAAEVVLHTVDANSETTTPPSTLGALVPPGEDELRLAVKQVLLSVAALKARRAPSSAAVPASALPGAESSPPAAGKPAWFKFSLSLGAAGMLAAAVSGTLAGIHWSQYSNALVEDEQLARRARIEGVVAGGSLLVGLTAGLVVYLVNHNADEPLQP